MGTTTYSSLSPGTSQPPLPFRPSLSALVLRVLFSYVDYSVCASQSSATTYYSCTDTRSPRELSHATQHRRPALPKGQVHCLLRSGPKCPSCPQHAAALTPCLLLPGHAPNSSHWASAQSLVGSPRVPAGTPKPHPVFRPCFQHLIQGDALSRQDLPPNPTSQ